MTLKNEKEWYWICYIRTGNEITLSALDSKDKMINLNLLTTVLW